MTTEYASTFLCLLQFLSTVSYSLSDWYFTPLIKFIPRYFILTEIVNGIVFLIAFSDSSLLAYRKATDFCVLVFILQIYCIHLLFLIVFLVESLGLFIYKIMWSSNRQFYFFLSNLDNFYFFYLHNCSGRTSNTMLNKSGKSGHPCLVPEFSGKAFSFSPLSMMLAVGLSCIAFIMLKYIPSIPTLLVRFYHKWVFNTVKCFFCIYWDDHMVFIFLFF